MLGGAEPAHLHFNNTHYFIFSQIFATMINIYYFQNEPMNQAD